MTSSIFSSDRLRRLRGQPPRVVVAWLARAAAVVAVLWVCIVILDRTNPAIAAWNTDSAEILFVGSSHTATGIDPAAFDGSAGVVSFPGLDHRLSAAAIGRHLDRWPRLGRAFLEVDEFTLLTDMSGTMGDNPLEVLARLDLSLWDLPPAPERGVWWRARMLLAGKGTGALDPSVRFNTERVFYGSAPDESARTLTASAGVARMNYLKRIAAGDVDDNVRALVELTRLLAARRVEVTLLSYPQHRFYREARPAEWDRRIEQVVRAVQGVNGAVGYWDLRGDAAFADADFQNVDHLGDAGARKLSAMIADRIRAGIATNTAHLLQ
jgi:hypothetical protein